MSFFLDFFREKIERSMESSEERTRRFREHVTKLAADAEVL